MSSQNSILNQYGGPENNSLLHILRSDEENSDEEPVVFEHSRYVDLESLVEEFEINKNIFKVMSLNCQSLTAKIDQLKIYIETLKEKGCEFDAICLQETWIHESIDIDMFHLDGYHFIHKIKSCSSHGGLAIYLRDTYNYCLLNSTNNYNTWENQFIKVEIDPRTHNSLILGNLYRLPRESNQDYDNFIDEFSETVNALTNCRTDMVLFGDFNIDLLQIRNKPKVNEFFETLISSGLIPKITLPTRFSRNSATLIDNAICKMSHNFSNTSSYILTNRISDHQPCVLFLNYKCLSNVTHKFIKIEISNENAMQNFKREFEEINIDQLLNLEADGNPDSNYNILDQTITKLKDKHFPCKTVRFDKHKHKKTRWITNGIIKSIKFRDKLFMRLKSTPLNSDLHGILKTNLDTYNKILKNNIKAAKTQYYHDILLKYKNDTKNTWITIKDIINRSKNKKDLPNFFKINGNLISDPTQLVSKFNQYFNSLGPNLASKIVPPNNLDYTHYLNEIESPNFQFHDVTEAQVDKIIRNLPNKTSTGFDGISNKFVKQIKNCIIKPLTCIINQTLQKGIFPTKLKIAKIIPVFKKDDPQNLENYRPISVLPSMSKIFEKVILLQLQSHFLDFKLLYPSQYGFRERHSTEYAAIENIDRIANNLENKSLPLNIFLDLSKAFDTLDHSILLSKLSKYGITGSALELCKSYLMDRQQYVNLNGTISEMLQIKTGVPQGSILGPFLFLIYINDFDRSSSMFRFIIYADDTTLLVTISPTDQNSIEEFQDRINNELQNITNWLKVNKLSLNVAKTKFMVFRTPRKQVPPLQLYIDSHEVEEVTEFNYLGITIDNGLTWKKHIDIVCKKISKIVGIMARLRYLIPQQTLLTLYNSLVLPHLSYGSLLWGHKNKEVNKLQKKSVRIISRKKYNAHTDPLFKSLGILKFSDIVQLQEYKFIHKLNNQNLPLFFLSYNFVRHIDIHQHATRRNEQLIIPRMKLQISQCSVKFRLPQLINNLPDDIKIRMHTHSVKGLSFYYKKRCLDGYVVECCIPNCYICNN